MTATEIQAPGSIFAERSVRAAGFDVTYYEAGDGPVLIYLSGAGGPKHTYALDGLAQRFHVIMVEFPGWGGQPNDVADFDGLARQIAEIATALGHERFHLMGTSFGGACALHFVTLFPERVESLVLESPAKLRDSSADPATLAPDAFVRAFRKHPERVPHMTPPDPEFMGRVWPMVVRLMGEGTDDGIGARLEQVATRTLILFGRDDGIINPINGRTLRRLLRNSSLQYVYDAAHDIQCDRPEAFVDMVGDFLDRGMRFLINDHDGLINP